MYGRVFRAIVIVASILLVVSGCSFIRSEAPNEPIDPPPDVQKEDENNSDSTDMTESEDSAESGDNNTVRTELYFKSPEGYIVPYSVPVPAVEGIAEESLKYMVKGGPITKENILPEGFTPLLPEGTEILSLNIKKNGEADLDLSTQFLEYDEEDEAAIVGAITWALTAWDSVDQVNIWVNGKPLSEMPKGKLSAVNLTRDNTALNVELGEGVQISNSMPVTLYFLGQSGESVYYVPMTRLVSYSDNVAEATLTELIAGPREASGLSTEIFNNLEVNDISVDDDTVMVDFGEQLLEYGQENTVSERAIQSIVLSLTESTGASQVKISVDGKSDVAAKNISLAEPVSKPAQVNPSGL